MCSDISSRALGLAPTQLFIGGQWRASSSGATIDVVNPATEQLLAQVAAGEAADGRAAADAAFEAAAQWAATAPRVRSDILRRAYDAIMSQADAFAALITLEMGKPLADAMSEVRYGAEFFRWYSEEAVRINGRVSTAPEGTLEILTRHRPVGMCLFITPWNFPLAMATRKIGPALAAGCTCVVKPATLTPLTTLAVARVLQEAGLPDGVVNVAASHGSSALTDPILADPRLRKLSFTGSTSVGQTLLAQAAPGVLRTSMELGGCAPFIVLPDANLDVAVDAAVAAKVRSNGEACNAANTFYVHRSVVAEFSQRLAQRFAALRPGNGLDDGVDIGPLVSATQRRDVAALVEGAVAEGATVLTGGKIPDGVGFFYPPTVLGDVPADAEILRTEIFGPVAPITTFDTVDEVLARANRVAVGLAGYVYTESMAQVARMSRELQVGMIAVNTGPISNAAAPFGGIKHSGLGREGGPEGIAEYLDTLYIGLPR